MTVLHLWPARIADRWPADYTPQADGSIELVIYRDEGRDVMHSICCPDAAWVHRCIREIEREFGAPAGEGRR